MSSCCWLKTSAVISNGQKIINTYRPVHSSTVTITAGLPRSDCSVCTRRTNTLAYARKHSAAHNYLFKHSTGYFFFIFSQCTEAMAAPTKCRLTFGIFQLSGVSAAWGEYWGARERFSINIQEAIITSGLCRATLHARSSLIALFYLCVCWWFSCRVHA